MSTEFTERWVRISEGLVKHPMLDIGPYDTRSAWLWMIINAAWKQHRTRVSGKLVTLERGQVVVGRDHLAAVWKWSPSRVRTFLAEAEREKMIAINHTVGRIANVATICNYDKYQSASREKRQLNSRSVAYSSPVDRQTVDWDTRDTGIACNARVEEIPGLNGATAVLVEQLARWLAGDLRPPDLHAARKILAGNVEIHGYKKVRAGMIELETQIAAGTRVTDLGKAFSSFVKNAKLVHDGSEQPMHQVAPDAVRYAQPVYDEVH